MGNIKNVAKTAKKEQLIVAYNQLFESKVNIARFDPYSFKNTHSVILFFTRLSIDDRLMACAGVGRGLKALKWSRWLRR